MTTTARARIPRTPMRGIERLAFSVDEAAAATGIGRTTLYALIREGELESSKIGKRRLILASDLQRLIASHRGPSA